MYRTLTTLVVTLLAVPCLADSIDDLKSWLANPADHRPAMIDQTFAKTALTRDEADAASKLLIEDRLSQIRATRAKEWKEKSITIGDKTMKFDYKVFGDKPKDGHSLYISMHGGGGAPSEVNEQQWKNQIRLYEPKEGIYLAPRAPTDNWNLWHEAHIDPLFDRLIEDAIAMEGINPNRVYLTGYSAGGDGTYQLAPRMADRFAAAAVCAGHPNEASPLGLRNLPFAIHVGALDAAYDRNKIAAEWGKKLDELQKTDPDGYVHVCQLHDGRAHWMNREDKVAIEWMASFTRNAFPSRIVWHQDDVTHTRFYWIGVPNDQAKVNADVIVSRDQQTITIEKATEISTLKILLNDAMIDLDQAVVVKWKGRDVISQKTNRTIANISKSLDDRADPTVVFSAEITVDLK